MDAKYPALTTSNYCGYPADFAQVSGLSGPSTDQQAFQALCSNSGGWCDAVAVSGAPVIAPRNSSGQPVPSITDKLFLEAGLTKPANTYIFTSGGPKVKFTMGGCSVRPIGSAIVQQTGFFQACAPANSYSYANDRYYSNAAPYNQDTTCG